MSEQITPNPSVPTQVVQELKFPRFINNLGIIPTSYKDSMSYYESLAWLCKFLEETVIPTLNENGEAVEELQGLYIELNSYVTNYLDNYNFQEEVNKKLDELTESGYFDSLITDYLKLKRIYNTTVDMITDKNNLVNGMKIQTLGYSEINDYGNANYVISNVQNNNIYQIDLENGLYANLIHNKTINAEILGIEKLNELNSYYQYFDKIILNKDYEVESSVEVDNIIIDGNNHTISGQNDLLYHFTLGNNSTLKNIKFTITESLISNYGNFCYINGSNINVINNEIEGFIGILANQNKNYSDINISNNIMNCKRFNILLNTGVFDNITIENNKQTIPQTWETPNVANQCIYILNKISVPYSTNSISHTTLQNKGHNYSIRNNTFNQINTRAIEVVNAYDVIITDNKAINPYGNKTDHELVGYSDDIIVLEFCNKSIISNNLIKNSGENGIDLLSSSECQVTNNVLLGIDMYGVDINIADFYINNITDNTVTFSDLESSNNIVSDNIIQAKNVGIALRNGRNSIFQGNKFSMTSDHVNNIGVYLSTNAYFTASGNNYENIYIDNLKDPSMRNYCDANNIYKASNIYLGQQDHFIYSIEIDNSSLDNNDSLKTYEYTHSLHLTNAKFFYIYNDKRYDFEPLSLINNSFNAPFGIKDVQIFENRIRFKTYKHFLPLDQNDLTTSFYNVTSGTLYIEAW